MPSSVPSSPTDSLTVSACCSGPVGARFEPEAAVTTAPNRWNAAGEPTIYLAGDPGVAIAEVGRHWHEQDKRLVLWRVDLSLSTVADLRRPDVRSALAVPDDPMWFLDRGHCQALARRQRSAGCEGLIVPSVAFLDDWDRWTAVVFADRVAPSRAVRAARPIAEIGSTEASRSRSWA